MDMPKFFSMFRKKDFNKKQFGLDLKAGIAVAIISLPLAIALGISSGLTPQAGFITAIIAGLVTSIFSGSPVQIGGPTSAFVIVVYGIVHKYGVDGLIISTVMGGIILIILGFLRLGSLAKYIPYPIMLGFTAGIAAILAVSQLKDFLGLTYTEGSGSFMGMLKDSVVYIGTINIEATIIGLASIVLLIVWPKFNKKLPASLVVLILATIIVKVLGLHIATIGSTFGHISASLPTPHIPTFSFAMIKELIGPAITIALLSALSSLLAVVVSDEALNERHDTNTELVAQGLANIASVLLGGMPASGVVARTTANVKGGGRTPFAGIFHAVILFIVMIALMPLASYIPLTTLGAILLIVAYKMVKWKTIKLMFKCPKTDLFLLIVTFALTIIFNLVVAIEAGMIIALFMFMVKMSRTLEIKELDLKKELSFNIEGKKVLIKELKGTLFFGSASIFDDAIKEIEYSDIDVLIFKMININQLDVSALKIIGKLASACELYNIKFIIAGLTDENKEIIHNIKGDSIPLFDTVGESLDKLSTIYA